MEEKQLFKLALIIALLGLLILIFISNSIEIEEYKIKDIDQELLEKTIRTKGTITRLTETPGLYIMDITDETGTITAINFKENPINITQNQEIEIEGKVIKYKDKLEIEISKIKI